MSAIEQQILNSLQGNEISKSRSRFAIVDTAVLTAVRSKVPGNTHCVDCDAPSEFSKTFWRFLKKEFKFVILIFDFRTQLGKH